MDLTKLKPSELIKLAVNDMKATVAEFIVLKLNNHEHSL